jgi:hypothetical protein
MSLLKVVYVLPIATQLRWTSLKFVDAVYGFANGQTPEVAQRSTT